MTASRSFSATSGWITVAFLTIAYLFSFIDRWILGLLIEPIKADLGLTDTQIGLLLGPAFAIFYATMGLPLGWLADRRNRVRIVAVGIGLWSIATAASGLAKSFIHLFIARMSIGVGEATLSPCAMSIISDSFPREKRSRPIAVYTTALSLGAGLASLPDYMAADKPHLVRVLPNLEGPSYQTYFVYTEAFKNDRRLEVFRDFLFNEARDWHY